MDHSIPMEGEHPKRIRSLHSGALPDDSSDFSVFLCENDDELDYGDENDGVVLETRSQSWRQLHQEGSDPTSRTGLRRRRSGGDLSESRSTRDRSGTSSPFESRDSRSSHSVRLDPLRNRRRFRKQSRWIIPIDHPVKTTWDILTVVLSVANAYATHVSIQERRFGYNPFISFCNAWFLLDILLNFVTERKTADCELLRDYRSICARYLISWFAVDALALIPWETLYIQPVIDLQNQRGFFKKSFFRSKAVVRVSRHLKGKHFRWFGALVRRTKQHGIGAKGLLQLIIRYVPKYVMWVRNMKGLIALRLLRQVNWFRRFCKIFGWGAMDQTEKPDGMTGSLSRDEFEDDMSSKPPGRHSPAQGLPAVHVTYEPWEMVDDDDDGVPL
eukprot:Nitzschia sp. Nitz4//scaffold137_size62074//49070//50227//NITZ4_006426-RA/size62074-processed-gene-0.96-mRNA-1//-1//CDS//3329535733//3107//frame0